MVNLVFSHLGFWSGILFLLRLFLIFAYLYLSIYPDSSDISLSDFNVTVEDRDTRSQITEQLQDFLPAVTAHYSEHSRLEEWIAIFFSNL